MAEMGAVGGGTPASAGAPAIGAAPGAAPAAGSASSAAPEPKAGEGAHAQPAPAQEPPKAPKLKVHGKELDAPAWMQRAYARAESDADRADLVCEAQRALAADETFRSASETRKQVEGFFAAFKGTPAQKAAALKRMLAHPDIGGDAQEVARELLAEQFELDSMTPEQREVHELKAERDRLKAEREQEQKAAQEREQQAQRSQMAQRLQSEIVAAVKSATDLPQTGETVQMVSRLLMRDSQLRAQLDPSDPRRSVALTPADVIPLVRQDYERLHEHFLGGLPVEKLIERLGPERVKAIREHFVKEYEKQGVPAAGQPGAPRYTPRPTPNGEERPTFAQLREQNPHIFGRPR